ncbi:MAG: thioredoxin family protein [Treponemataceae bacterium]|nr:thioredoxin family protein [Treponemataceae bacterium]
MNMKKMLMVAAALGAALSFVACKKTAQPSFAPKLDLSKSVDATQWLDNLDDAKIAAQQADKKIILFFSADDQDQLSVILKENLLNKDEFLADITGDYVLVNLDFSNSRYEQAQEDEALSAALEENMKLATVYGVQMSPMFFLLTKEGYPITALFYDTTLQTADDFRNEIAQNAEAIATFDAAYAALNTGSDEDKVRAIDALYEIADPRQTYVFAPLAEQVLALDPKNKTGLLGKYVLALADARATNAALDNDPQGMAAAFVDAAKNKFLSPEEKQQAYYYAGYFLAGSGDPDYAQIKKYVQASYDAAPDSDRAPQIALLLQAIDERMSEPAQDESQADAPATDSGAPAAE